MLPSIISTTPVTCVNSNTEVKIYWLYSLEEKQRRTRTSSTTFGVRSNTKWLNRSVRPRKKAFKTYCTVLLAIKCNENHCTKAIEIEIVAKKFWRDQEQITSNDDRQAYLRHNKRLLGVSATTNIISLPVEPLKFSDCFQY